MTREQYLESAPKTIAAYKYTIKVKTEEIEKILDGQSLQSEGPDGMPVFHPRHAEVKKINYEIADFTNRLKHAEKELERVLAE